MSSPATFDVVVAGGGTAGCVLAARLSEDPSRRVCLVEAGPDYGPHDSGRWPEDILDARRLALDSHRWTQTDAADRSQARARVLGGCSSHNACALVRGEPRDYDEWPEGWGAAELEPYLDRAERELRARFFADDELSPWHRAFVEAAGELVHRHLFNVVGSTRWNAAFAYLDAARGRANLTILADTLVDRVRTDGAVVTSRGELSAGTVVLAAGAYGSPAILLRSGFGPPIGEGLADHVGVGMGWRPTQSLQDDCAAFEGEHPLFMAGTTVKVDDLFLFPAVDPGYEISAAVFFMKPRSRGRVRLTDDDPEAPLAIEHGFLGEPCDAEPLVEGLRLTRDLVRRPPLARYAEAELRPGDVDLHEYVRANARGFFHPTGTCAMSVVVDERCRVHGDPRLVVGDASILPTIPRANTNLTVAAVAERLAELL